MSIKVLSKFTPDPALKFEGAWVQDLGNQGEPVGMFGGVLCAMSTKPSLLELGVCRCAPVADIPGQTALWPLCVVLSIDGVVQVAEKFTQDPAAVAAVRHFARLALAGKTFVGQRL